MNEKEGGCLISLQKNIQMDEYIPHAIISSILLSASNIIFRYTHSHSINLAELFWTITVMRPKHLLNYFPLVSGIFFISGILFDAFQYNSVLKVAPYGPESTILQRSSMYGYAIGGFTTGFGGQLAGGDLVYFLCGGILQGKWFVLVLIALIYFCGMFLSVLCQRGYFWVLTNEQINPLMQNLHWVSANITILISIILLIVSSCTLMGKLEDKKKTAKKIAGSFIAGAMIAFSFVISSLSVRTRIFQGLTPGSKFDPFLAVIIVATIIINSIIYHLSKKEQNSIREINAADHEAEIPEQEAVKEEAETEISKMKMVIGAVLIGIGWGIAGIDYAVFLIHSAIFTIPTVIVYGAFLIFGSMLCQAI